MESLIEANTRPESFIFAIDLLFRSSQVMVPVITGFIVLVSAIVGKIWESSDEPIEYRLVGVGIALGIISLFLWLGVMPFCYKAALGYDQDVWGYGSFDSAAFFLFGRRLARAGQITFGIAVVMTSWFCLRVAVRRNGSKG